MFFLDFNTDTQTETSVKVVRERARCPPVCFYYDLLTIVIMHDTSDRL